MPRRLRGAVLSCALVTGLVAVAVTTGCLGAKSSPTLQREILASSSCTGPSFCITSSANPTLYPGAAPSSLPLTFSNPLNVPIRVYSLTVTFTNAFPSGCVSSALQVSGTAASASTPVAVPVTFASPAFAVPAAVGSTPGSAVYNATLDLADNHLPQNACAGLHLVMSYTASAYYTIPTTTALVATPNPATVGQSDTLTATVSPAVTPSSAGTTPAGSVTFYQCPTAACATSTALGSAVTLSSSGVAASTTTFAAQGTYYLRAVYTPTDSSNFTAGTSSTITDTANYTSCITATSSGNLTVSSGQTDCITTTGKVTGSVTVNSGGRLDILGGTVGGNVTINAGSGLSIYGGTVGGNVNASAANLLSVCAAKVSGNLSTTSSSAWVLIGDSDSDATPACAGNTISGNLTVTGNSAGAEVGANSISGGTSITGTTGAGPGSENTVPEIEHNNISGGLACASNTPLPTDDNQPNTVKGKRTGQCSATGF